MMAYTDVDRLILERWNDTMGLFEAYEELEDRIGETIQEVGERVGAWLGERGYQSDTDAKEPAFSAWKDEWRHRRRDEPLVYISVGAFAPSGYRKVKDEHPFLWVYVQNLHLLKIKDSERDKFAKELRLRLGDAARDWAHEDANDPDQPLGKYLTDISDQDRVRLVAEPDRLFEFATSGFEQLFSVSEAIGQTLEKFRSAG